MYVVILAGGASKRLWPIATQDRPKNLIKWSDDLSLLQKTFIRASKLHKVQKIITVTNQALVEQVGLQYQQISHSHSLASQEIIVEPQNSDTNLAILTATLYIQKNYGAEAKILVLPSDHLISPQSAFIETVEQACQQLDRTNKRRQKIILFGLKPSYPETNYGYIQTKNHQVVQFVEKPNRQQAQRYIASGKFLWNAGILYFQAAILLREAATHCANTLELAGKLITGAKISSLHNITHINLPNDLANGWSDISIDYAILQKTTNLQVITCNFAWSDVGSWQALSQIAPANDQGNQLVGRVLTHETNDCYIYAQDQLVTAIGVKNLVIAQTQKGVLVVSKEKSAAIKQLYHNIQPEENIKKSPNQVKMTNWGHVETHQLFSNYQVTCLEIRCNQQIDVNNFFTQAVNLLILSGQAVLQQNTTTKNLYTNDNEYLTNTHNVIIMNQTQQLLKIMIIGPTNLPIAKLA